MRSFVNTIASSSASSARTEEFANSVTVSAALFLQNSSGPPPSSRTRSTPGGMKNSDCECDLFTSIRNCHGISQITGSLGSVIFSAVFHFFQLDIIQIRELFFLFIEYCKLSSRLNDHKVMRVSSEKIVIYDGDSCQTIVIK